jgi:hypothetical protein
LGDVAAERRAGPGVDPDGGHGRCAPVSGEMWLDWLQPWATYCVDVEEVIDAGDRVVVLVRDRGRRHDMEAEVGLISGSVWEVRDGRIARVHFCGDRGEALAAAGLGERATGGGPEGS